MVSIVFDCDISRSRPKKEGDSDHEEEFYYTEREVAAPAPPPTLSHRDMCRPPHEDPEYQRQLVGSFRSAFNDLMIVLFPTSIYITSVLSTYNNLTLQFLCFQARTALYYAEWVRTAYQHSRNTSLV